MTLNKQIWIALLSLVAIILHVFLQIYHVSYALVPLFFPILIGGVPLALNIAFKFVRGDLGADLLALLALVSGLGLGEYLVSVIIILMLASGQSLEYYAKRKASSVLLALAERMPSVAHRKTDHRIDNVSLESIRPHDTILIYPHETCPVDGIVLEGHGTMDESYLTGEPYQIPKAPGTAVLSGAINGETLLVITATEQASDSRYASIVKVLEEAEQKRPSMRRLGDQLGAIFAPIILLSAILAWFFTGETMRFLAVLVIATPCPLLIAIPICIISAVSKAAKKSIIIKDPTVLEQLPRCKTAIFDKTGTLTYGKPTLTTVTLFSHYTQSQILQYTASIERYSKHPLASAILNAAKAHQLAWIESLNVSETPGQELWGIIDGHTVSITSRKHVLHRFPDFAHLLPDEKSGLECVVLIDEALAAVLHFHDEPRLESKSFVKHLRPYHQLNKILLVSGDRISEVNYLAKQIHFNNIYASQSPEQKLELVRKETQQAPTVFMGDGINDAPALTAATVGIAFGQYSHVTAEAAGAVILENKLSKLDELLHLCLDTRKIALQSALGGMLLSLVGVLFAALGYIPPITGAILQEIIDVVAIMNALRLTWGTTIKIDFSA